MAQPDKEARKNNGPLKIPLPFEEAVRAALEVRPAAGEPPATKKRAKKSRRRKT